VLKELPIYGSSRLGVYKVPAAGLETDRNKLTLGRREYEVSNHLGNVLAVVSDLKLPAARVLSHTDYYAFGSAMAGRSGGAGYRYGFNGKENDRDFGNAQFIQDYGFRLYNPAIGKFLSVDPLAADFPWNSPYAFAENDVIRAIDLEGAEKLIVANFPPLLVLAQRTNDIFRRATGGITAIDWTVYGTVATAGGNVQYWYDASGQRAVKTVGNVRTWYVRDAPKRRTVGND
jgi:RHS repeat-associated protein